MTNLTFVTALAPYHDALIARCTASVEAQTTPCNHIIIRDEDGKGAGWARNRGLEAVQTEFVAFLDADDWVEPTFAERMRDAYDGTAYLYSDWYQEDQRIAAPDCAWWRGTWHCITTLLPTEWVRAIDGFEEQLPAGEDTAFYLKLRSMGYCGKRLAEPLFHYGSEGQRSKAFEQSDFKQQLLQRFTALYGGARMSDCGGCGGGGNMDIPQMPVNIALPGTVLAKAMWGGNRTQMGYKTGTFYPRAGNGKLMWVYPDDIDAAPHLWRRVEEEQQPIIPQLPILPRNFHVEPVVVAERSNADPDVQELAVAAGIMDAVSTPAPAIVQTNEKPATDGKYSNLAKKTRRTRK